MSLASLTGYGAVIDGLADLSDAWGDEPTAVVGTNVEYSKFVEFGTSRMAAQPHLRPAVESAVRRADAIAAQADSTEELVWLLGLDIEGGTKERAPVDTGNLRASYRAEML